jgi:SAM-dependent methyltransferase
VDRLLVATVLRPFGEHLATFVRPQPGDICVEVGDNGDVQSLPDGSAQVVTSLFTLAEQPDPAGVLREILRILDPHGGRLGVALWSEAAAVPHLDALTPADPHTVEQATRFGFPLAAEHLVEQAGGADRIRVSRIHDVVRFDGAAHWWAALGVADETHRAECEARLQPYAAPDGTLRIPTEAVVLTAFAA